LKYLGIQFITFLLFASILVLILQVDINKLPDRIKLFIWSESRLFFHIGKCEIVPKHVLFRLNILYSTKIQYCALLN